MTSPFLERPASEWIASNDLAFAIRDADPASPGHTLVAPRRLAPTWFDATPEERRAIFELVDEVKHQLGDPAARGSGTDLEPGVREGIEEVQ